MLRLRLSMCGVFCFFKVEQLLVHETKHLSVCKTGAPMLVPADVLLQNRCVGFRKSILLYNRANSLFPDAFNCSMKSSMAHCIFMPIRRYYKHFLYFSVKILMFVLLAGIVNTVCGKTNTITSL